MMLTADPGKTCFLKILYVEVIDPSSAGLGRGEILVYCRQRNLCLASWAASVAVSRPALPVALSSHQAEPACSFHRLRVLIISKSKARSE